jgi:hypothetical protein
VNAAKLPDHSEGLKDCADGVPKAVDGSFGGLSQEGF